MFKKIFAGAIGATFAAVSMFAGNAAFAVDRLAGQVNGDWGSTAVNGVAYDNMGVDNDNSVWTASLGDGTDMYIAGVDHNNDSINVQHFTSGVRDMTFGADGQAEFELNSDANFDTVSAIHWAQNGDLILIGNFWDNQVNYEYDGSDYVKGIFALRIADNGAPTSASFGNSEGANLDASLDLSAFYPTAGYDLNQNYAESYASSVAAFDFGGGATMAIAGGTWSDSGDAAWVMFVGEDGTLDTSYGNSVDAGFTYLDSDYNYGSGEQCYGQSSSYDIVFSAYYSELYWAVNCDYDSAIQALDPTAGGQPDPWWAQGAGDEGGFVWLGDQSAQGSGSYGYQLGIDSNENLIIGGETWIDNPAGDGNYWSPWVARMDTSGTYYVDNDGFSEDANVHLWDSTLGDGYWGLNDMVIDSNDSIYLIGYRNTGNDNNMWASRFGSDLSPDYAWNDGSDNGNTVIGGCGNEYANTAQINGGDLYLFGAGDSPVDAPESPFSGNRDAASTKIGLDAFTQTRTVLAAPTWNDSEWNDTFIPGQSYTDAVSATGTDVSYYVHSDLPGGVTLNPSTGAISGTTDASDTGSYNVNVCAANRSGHIWTGYSSISAPSPYAPVLSPVPALDDENPYLGTSLEWLIPVDGYPVPNCWVSDGELPPGLTLNEDTCVITGTPLIKGDYWFEIGTENTEGSDYQEYSGTVGGAIDTDISASLAASLGDMVADSDVDLLGFGLEPGSTWYAELHSDPIRFDDGIVNDFGWFSLTSTLPSDIAPGQHTITVYGTDVDGNPVSGVVYITVKADGTLGYVSAEHPEPAALASTGVDADGVNTALLAGVALLMAGIVVAVRRRRA